MSAMTEYLPDIPAGSIIRQNADGSWQHQRRGVGPWLPMPAPQGAVPWLTDGPATQGKGAPAPTRQQALTALHAIASGANDTREQFQDIETIRDALNRLPPDV
jgi:hypothetical protein